MSTHPASLRLTPLKVNIVFNLFILFTLPTTLQFSFGIFYSSYTDILPSFRDAAEGDAHFGIKIATVVAPLLPFAFLTSASVCMAMLWTNEGTSSRHPSADGAATGFKVCLVVKQRLKSLIS